MFLFKNKEKINVICDIGLRSIGIALVRDGSKLEVIYSKRIYLSREEAKSHSENLELSTNAIFEDLTKNGLKILKNKERNFSLGKMYCALNSPWYMAETIKINIHRKDSFVISQKIIDEELEKEERKFREKISVHFSKKIFHEGVQMLERTITSFFVNGYSTEDPLQKKAHSLELTAYMSAMPRQVFESIKNKAQKFFHIDEVVFTTFPLVLLRATRVLYQNELNFVTVHLGAESTDISVINQGGVAESGVIPFGYEKVIDLVQEKFGVSSDIAFSFISILSSDMADFSTKDTLKLTISQEIENWKKDISSLLKKWPHFSKRKIFLISEREIEPVFKAPLKEALPEIAEEVFTMNQSVLKEKIVIGPRSSFDHSLFTAIFGFLNFPKRD